MIYAQAGNLIESIKDLKLDGIQNAANGRGPMGRGIAGAIKRAGGDEIQSDAKNVCLKLDPQPGQAYSTTAGSLKEIGINRIIHAVTMKDPGGYTSLEIIKQAFKSSIELAKKEQIKRFGVTALGTGIGGLDPIEVGKIMKEIAEKEDDIEIFFIDFDQKFINAIKKRCLKCII